MSVKFLQNNLRTFFDLFLPRLCAACSKKLSTDEVYVCSKCSSELILAPRELIRKEYERKFKSENLISDFLSLYIFEKDSVIQNIVHALKYDLRYQIGFYLGESLAVNLRNQINLWKPDIIIPIPLHKLKQADRGFNQAAKISRGLGNRLDIKVDYATVRRKRFTQTQTTLTLKERRENMKDAFEVKNNKNITKKNIILVDDVITTGATTSECARVLSENGANKIYAVSVAIAE